MKFKVCVWLSMLGCFLLFAGSTYKTSEKVESWQVRTSSSLKVNGKTNINSFNCVVGSYERTDTIDLLTTQIANAEIKTSGKLLIPIERFDCHHKVMTRDLQKTLKHEQFPVMIIDFVRFSKSLEGLPTGSTVTAKAEITLAGAKKNYVIDFHLRQYTTKQIELTGTKPILFSDFGLKPPSKLGGTIKVKNELEVEIKLQLTRI